MKLAFCCLLVLFQSFVFAAKKDSFIVDTNYRLYDVQPGRTVDTSIRIQFTRPESRPKRKSDEWITGPLGDGGSSGLGGNYDSIHNINPKVAGFITVCFLSFVLFIIYRVRRSLKKDQRNRQK